LYGEGKKDTKKTARIRGEEKKGGKRKKGYDSYPSLTSCFTRKKKKVGFKVRKGGKKGRGRGVAFIPFFFFYLPSSSKGWERTKQGGEGER